MFFQFVSVLALASCLMLAPWTSAHSAIEFIGTGIIPGSAVDNLGLTNPIDAAGTPQNRMGGLGSAIAYTGIGNVFVATPDRGPADGASTYLDRYYKLNIAIDPVAKTVTPTLLSTQLLSQGPGEIFTGNSGAISNGLRFDPEGVRVGKTGSIYISDEYGPFVYQFDQYGNKLKSIKVPDKFLIANPSADSATELQTNSSGRQANRGMEGLAINPEGTMLYGMMQNALIQDHALDSSYSRVGLNNRLLEMNLQTGATQEFLYQVNKKSYGVNEILAVNDHQFLTIERDGKAGDEAKFKQIYLIDTTGATDISNIASLSEKDIPNGVTPVSKSLFLDLLDPAYGLAGDDFPEKIEGLAFGPELADGRLTLLVTSDNDFDANNPTKIFAFAIDPKDLNYVPQIIAPVPGTIVLLGTGLLGLLAGRRRFLA